MTDRTITIPDPKNIEAEAIETAEQASQKILSARARVAQRTMSFVLQTLTHEEIRQILQNVADSHGLKIEDKDPEPQPDPLIEEFRLILQNPARDLLENKRDKRKKYTYVRSGFDAFGKIKLRDPKTGNRALSIFDRNSCVIPQYKRTEDGKLMVIMTEYPIQIEGWTTTDEKRNGRGALYKRWDIHLKDALTEGEELIRKECAKAPKNRPPLNTEVETRTIGEIAILVQPEKYSQRIPSEDRRTTVPIATATEYDPELLARLQRAIDQYKKTT